MIDSDKSIKASGKASNELRDNMMFSGRHVIRLQLSKQFLTTAKIDINGFSWKHPEVVILALEKDVASS